MKYCSYYETSKFPVFSPATSMIITNKNQDKILLIRQHNIENFMLVAGYIDKGEDAEQTVKREVKEDLGMDVVDLQYNQSQYFEKSDTFMLNFTCIVAAEEIGNLSDEVDHAEWFPLNEQQRKFRKAVGLDSS